MEKRYIVEFDENYRGLEILGLFRDHGMRCGYVLIPNEIEGKVRNDAEPDSECIPIDVHGGVTFAGNLPGFDGYFIGFDCCHWGDAIDHETLKKHFPDKYEILMAAGTHPTPDDIIRDTEFVRSECKKMVDQIIDIYYDDVTNDDEEEKPMNGEMFEKLSEKEKCSYLAQALSKKGGLHIADMPWAREYLVRLLDDRYNELYLEEGC